MLDLGLFIAVALFIMDYYVTKEKHEREVDELKKLVKDKDAEINATIDSLLSHVKAEANRAAASATAEPDNADNRQAATMVT